jgi:hypothetical protein
MYFKDLISAAAGRTTLLKQRGCSSWSALTGVLAGIACVALPLTTQAQSYPNKPITFYVSYGAGATTDITARALARSAEAILGVPIAVDNKGGGGGTVAAGMLVSKKPDGYAVLIGSTAAVTIRPLLMKVSYKATDIVGVMRQSLETGKQETQRDIAKLEQRIQVFERTKKRPIKKGGGDNVFAQMIDGQISMMRRGIEMGKAEIGNVDDMLKILKDYQYRADPGGAPNAQQMNWGIFASR